MKKQMQGIALILFGILLTAFGGTTGELFNSDYNFLFSCIGVIIGTVGLAFVFSKGENKNEKIKEEATRKKLL